MQMDRRTAIVGLTSVGATVVGGAAFAQANYPNANVRLIVPFAAGGGADTFARLFSDRLGRLLGQSVIVDNRGGGGGITAGLEVSRAPADGYTLIFHSPTSGVTGPLTRRTRPFDPVSGFAPISILTISPLVLAVSNKAQVNSLAELVAKARANPGKLTYGSSGLGGVPHRANCSRCEPVGSTSFMRLIAAAHPLSKMSSPATSTSSSIPRRPCCSITGKAI
jgi:tripartite-type tricarboxylate transporter receptor subunit TctC